MKTADKASILIKRVKSTKIGLKETERNKLCMRVILKKWYELVRFLWSYKVHTSEFAIYLGGCKVRKDNKSIPPFRTNPLVHKSKLISYTLAQ